MTGPKFTLHKKYQWPLRDKARWVEKLMAYLTTSATKGQTPAFKSEPFPSDSVYTHLLKCTPVAYNRFMIEVEAIKTAEKEPYVYRPVARSYKRKAEEKTSNTPLNKSK